MNKISLANLQVDILHSLSDTLNGRLSVERYGLVLEHLSGKVRWIQMDGQTYALVFDFIPKIDFSFQLKARTSEHFFHSLFLQEGDILISGLTEKDKLNFMPRESLYFHSDKQSLTLNIRKGKQCKLLVISHSAFGSGNPFLNIENKSHLEIGLCNSDACQLLESIFRTGRKSKPFIELKGLLFLLMGSTMPEHYKNMSNAIIGSGSLNSQNKHSAKPSRRTKFFRKGDSPAVLRKSDAKNKSTPSQRKKRDMTSGSIDTPL